MAEDEFNFKKIEYREPRRFEPPPWEQEEAPEGTSQEEAEELAAEERQLGEGAEKSSTAEEEPPSEEPEPSAVKGSAEGPVEEAELSAEDSAESGEVEAMFAELKTEEESGSEDYFKLSLVMIVIVAAIGLVTAISGIVLAFRSGGSPTGALLALVLIATGLGFVAIGLRLLYKTYRQRGAL
ncbi:MAG: hypothetical protein AB2L09_10775 [Coriobacteriia bacterium]